MAQRLVNFKRRPDDLFGDRPKRKIFCRPYLCFICAHLWLKNSNWFHRSADCPNPQRAAIPTNHEIIPVVSGQATRYELGQLALR